MRKGSNQQIKVYAHRGSSIIWPENTMLAFEQAHHYRAAGLETDLRLSKDGVIVLSHDDNLSRFHHPGKTVGALTAAEIEQIEITSPDGKFSDKMMTLETLLRRFPDKDYIFDCKITSAQMMEKLKQILSKLNFRNQVWFLTWSREADLLVEKYFPDFPCFPRMSTSTGWGLISLLGLGALLRPKHEILSLPAYFGGLPLFTKAQVRSVREQGKEFVGYLINTEGDFTRCVTCKVRTVLTDRPDLISHLIQGTTLVGS